MWPRPPARQAKCEQIQDRLACGENLYILGSRELADGQADASARGGLDCRSIRLHSAEIKDGSGHRVGSE